MTSPGEDLEKVSLLERLAALEAARELLTAALLNVLWSSVVTVLQTTSMKGATKEALSAEMGALIPVFWRVW